MLLKLGTRKSLLAWAQSSWVARELEKLNSGLKVELVGVETRGDRVLDISLSAMEGKEFFVAELDHALKSAAVDFTVHSMKDLSLERPPEFILGCNPKRENPRDVVLFGPGVMDKIAQGKILRIGTSSPRRLENIPEFLKQALPVLHGHSPKVEFCDIRGNVNTRLGRVHLAESSEKHLDAVVLAFAGIIRLWNDHSGREELRGLLHKVRWMVLPLRECPAAPAQGALAVECRRGDLRTQDVLKKLHDPETAELVSYERALLAEWGGGCHQKLGATAILDPTLGMLHYIRGRKPDQGFVNELRWSAPSAKAQAPFWDGSSSRAHSEIHDLPGPAVKLENRAVFIAHARAVNNKTQLLNCRLWTSGTASWFKLAKQGFWVEGCAENLGYQKGVATFWQPSLQLPDLKDWAVLTHEAGVETWSVEKVYATYSVSNHYSEDTRKDLRAAQTVFWSSASQWIELKGEMGAGVLHCCGVGKTAEHLRANGIEPLVFPSVGEWRVWAKI